MYVVIDNSSRKKLFSNAITKAGNQRKLCRIMAFSKGALFNYKDKKSTIPIDRLFRLEQYSEYKSKRIKVLPLNWRQKIAGKISIQKQKQNGTFNETIERLRLLSSKRMKKWHRIMKKNHPEEYYNFQYSSFKKIGGYNCELQNGIKVRNSLEKEVGDLLIKNDIEFLYEQYLNLKGKVFFPDFLLNRIIIEVTGWKHPNEEKNHKLRLKMDMYSRDGYQAILLIPQEIRKFYKEFEASICSNLDELLRLVMPL